jgi:transposase
MTVDEKLDRIVSMLVALAEREQVREWYSTGQVAQLLGKSEYTVREWCRTGRANATKKSSGRGAHASWTVSHMELLRLQREGLLPCRRPA